MIIGYCALADSKFVHGVVEHIYDKVSCNDPILKINGPYGTDYKHLSQIFEADVPAWRQKSLPFYEVSAEDQSCPSGDPLLAGEVQTTHGQLIERYICRKNSHPPWVFRGPATSEHERWKRKQCLWLYRADLDDCIPSLLLKTGSWSKFWYAYSKLPHVQEAIKKGII